jgi:hypothetical protein
MGKVMGITFRAYLLGAFFAFSFSLPLARADLTCPQSQVDLGEVKSGKPLAHCFAFVNRGPDAIEITEIRPSCGCLKPRCDKAAYRPGESGALLFEVNTLTQPAGPHAWRVLIRYRSGSREGELPLVLSARVVNEVLVQPAALTIYTEAGAHHSLTLTDARPLPLAITEVRTTSPHLRARPETPVKDAAGRLVQTVRLEVLTDYSEGKHEEEVTLRTNDSEYPDLRVPVTVVKRPRQRVSAVPSSLNLSAPAVGAIPTRLVLVRANGDELVELERAEADDPAVTLQWSRGASPTATVRVGVDRKRLTGDGLQTTVRIHVAKPAPQVLTIPLTCTVR